MEWGFAQTSAERRENSELKVDHQGALLSISKESWCCTKIKSRGWLAGGGAGEASGAAIGSIEEDLN